MRPMAFSMPTLPPGLVRVAKEGLDGQGMQLVVLSELGTVIEGHSLAQGVGQGLEALDHQPRGGPGSGVHAW